MVSWVWVCLAHWLLFLIKAASVAELLQSWFTRAACRWDSAGTDIRNKGGIFSARQWKHLSENITSKVFSFYHVICFLSCAYSLRQARTSLPRTRSALRSAAVPAASRCVGGASAFRGQTEEGGKSAPRCWSGGWVAAGFTPEMWLCAWRL